MDDKKKNRRKLIYRLIIILVLILLMIKGCSIVREGLVKTGEKEIFSIKCSSRNCVNLVEVKDNDSTWKAKNMNYVNNLNVFGKETINPEDSGVYNFTVKNNVKKPVFYDIKFVETNPYNINLKYRIKQNNKYINEEWMKIDKIAISNSRLRVKESDQFQLEWKWFSSKNDNEVAGLIDKYEIKIVIDSEA